MTHASAACAVAVPATLRSNRSINSDRPTTQADARLLLQCVATETAATTRRLPWLVLGSVRTYPFDPTCVMPNFDAIRLFATVAIVLLHTAANGVNRLPQGSPDWWLANVLDTACRAGVPLFLMLSGALLLNRSHQSAKQFYHNRLHKLALPLLLWSLFYLLWSALKAQIKQQPYGFETAAEQLLAGAPYFHLWFIFMLAGVYLLLPLLRRFWQQLTPAQQTQFCWLTLILQQSLHGLYFLLALPEPPWAVVGDWLSALFAVRRLADPTAASCCSQISAAGTV